MNFNRSSLAVYFILGSQNVNDQDPLFVLEQALQGGVTCFQFREKGSGAKTGEAKFQLAEQMQKLCQKYQVPFFINDDLELAIRLNADGIHVGQDDLSIQDIRKIAPTKMKIGLSITTTDQAIEAEKLAVDYIGIGPIFQTTTKSDAKQPIGLEGVIEITKAVPKLPSVAIGGITKSDLIEIRKAGADGVAVISEIASADQPKLATESLVKLSGSI
ncbi:thiamine phosphate synthase [Amphibacillus indicireducens]|uniref:Thiamine-phosphate synthase n=1 Tax=Amphibacillus indicireducens TaxID=1076330 RepID=A0ABP7VP12_9BACI